MNTDRKTKVLVVEDDNLFLWSLGQFLKREGYEVCPATTAELAFDIAKTQPFDVVISDFHLPGLNGKEPSESEGTYPVMTVLISAYQGRKLEGTTSRC
jgi:DNA-binding response OmpR family regulator